MCDSVKASRSETSLIPPEIIWAAQAGSSELVEVASEDIINARKQ